MNKPMRLFAFLSALFLLLVAAGITIFAFDLMPNFDASVALQEFKVKMLQDEVYFWITVAVGGVFAVVAILALWALSGATRGAFRYDIDEGEVVVPLSIIQGIAEATIKAYPEIITSTVSVINHRRAPRMSLQLQVIGKTVFADLAKNLRGHLQREIGQQTGVIIKDINLRMSVTDNKPAMFLPRNNEIDSDADIETEEEQDINLPKTVHQPPFDLASVDLDLKPDPTPPTGKNGREGDESDTPVEPQKK
ncbi:MAG: alkaline shock response membrane anchor protein AmaP [Gammaproteobacteria bacterium]|nr:alkaline shock response membrane anchor protein AmaP [Gammaproteobacteria bacterium]